MSESETVIGHASIKAEFEFTAEIDEFADVVWPDEYTRRMAQAALIALRDEYRRVAALIDNNKYGEAGMAMDWDNLDPYRTDQSPTTEGETPADHDHSDEASEASINVVDLTPTA